MLGRTKVSRMDTLDSSPELLSAPCCRVLIAEHVHMVNRYFKAAGDGALAWWVVFSHVHMSGSRWGCHMLEASMHQLHTSLDTRVLLPLATPRKKGSAYEHIAKTLYTVRTDGTNRSRPSTIPTQHCAPYCATGRLADSRLRLRPQ